MKNFRLTLAIAALAIGSFAAFSFAPAKATSKLALLDFYVNPDGSRGPQVSGENSCPDDDQSIICSQEYDTVTNQPTGNPSRKHWGRRP